MFNCKDVTAFKTPLGTEITEKFQNWACRLFLNERNKQSYILRHEDSNSCVSFLQRYQQKVSVFSIAIFWVIQTHAFVSKSMYTYTCINSFQNTVLGKDFRLFFFLIELHSYQDAFQNNQKIGLKAQLNLLCSQVCTFISKILNTSHTLGKKTVFGPFKSLNCHKPVQHQVLQSD